MWRLESDEVDINEQSHLVARMTINSEALDNCDIPHHFWEVVSPEEDVDLSQEVMRCNKCGGLLPAALALWYLNGVNHGDKMKFGNRVRWKSMFSAHLDNLKQL